jgi:hypothetical protein
MDTFEMQDITKFSKDKRGALEYLMFLKEKCDGTVKGFACTDRHKQIETDDPGAVK